MEDIFTRLKRSFVEGGMLSKLIYINCGVFILVRLIDVILTLCGFGYVNFMQYLQYPSLPDLVIIRPWTIITYQFTHYDFWHILFNVLWLYWFGQIFLQYFNQRQLTGVYILGGVCGALFFTLIYNIFPYFKDVSAYSFLMGASASVMAVVFAISFYRKDYEIALLFIGRVKLIYLAIASLLLDILSVTSANSGGHIAHIGGAVFGVFFASMIAKGKDPTAFLNKIIDRIINLGGRRRPKMRVTRFNKRSSDYDYNARRQRQNEEVDEILDKLKRSGYESLSTDEKKKLFDASKR